jgi:hypothetical protein
MAKRNNNHNINLWREVEVRNTKANKKINKATRKQDEKVIADIYEQLDKFRIEKNKKKAFEDQIRLLEEHIATAGSLSEHRHSDKTYDMYTPRLSKTKTG